MNTELFFQAITDFDNGLAAFNLGSKWSFLFNQKCYPTRAFMRHYLELNGTPNDKITLHESVYQLSKIIPIFSSEIKYIAHRPVNI